MAGEIEEPFRHNFQADSLHSGSISFGRFKNEDLCWERRSSFSHNRYLEEVERYSKPGSVIEKKAILEAHFKRRALLSQSSCESRNSGGAECQTSGNDLSENNAHSERDDENVNSTGQSAHFSVTESTGYEGDFEHFNDCGYSAQSRDGSVFDGENELTEGEREEGCSRVTGTVNPESEIHATEENFGGENVTSSTAAPIPTSPEIDKDESTNSEPRPEIKQSNSRLSLVNPAKVTAIIVSKDATKDPVKDVTRKPRRPSGISSSVREKPVSAPVYCSVSRTPKHEVSSSYSSKSKSAEKEMRTKEKAHQGVDRRKRAVASATPSVKQNGSAFSFKSEERAERRKEFSMKLEEKMHAKEAEMNQLQTRKQEKSEAEIRRLRRSLNFKATPMPSFYHEAGQQSDRNKNMANRSNSSKPQRKQSSSSTVGAENDTSSSGATNNGSHFARKHLDFGGASSTIKHRKTISSDGSVSSPLPTPVVKNEQETTKQIPSSRKPKTPDANSNKVNKGPKGERKPKISSAMRTSNNVIKKDIKGIHFFAVGVAS
ncbi:PREDICTED: protein WVD2-like 7 [Ipomoea nil]|uniref:protein WVD2-like 7 n=1 Tax=Ipomoea nil TaxID=35883 RepID=UPI000900A529|nr:PREDICTED: protein WVD2-like 7 [Ipomoea nil]